MSDRCKRYGRGFTLIEVTLALGVAAISLIAIFGLLVTGSQTAAISNQQSKAADLLTAIAADLRGTPRTVATSPQFGIPIGGAGSGGSTTLFIDDERRVSTTLRSDSRYRLTVTPTPNGSGTRGATFLDIRITSPAALGSSAAVAATAEIFVAIDRN